MATSLAAVTFAPRRLVLRLARIVMKTPYDNKGDQTLAGDAVDRILSG
jgi:hypothetical protein